jgi:hypothetical protein
MTQENVDPKDKAQKRLYKGVEIGSILSVVLLVGMAVYRDTSDLAHKEAVAKIAAFEQAFGQKLEVEWLLSPSQHEVEIGLAKRFVNQELDRLVEYGRTKQQEIAGLKKERQEAYDKPADIKSTADRIHALNEKISSLERAIKMLETIWNSKVFVARNCDLRVSAIDFYWNLEHRGAAAPQGSAGSE